MTKPYEHNFRIEKMFEFYLKRTGLGPKEDMHPIQLRETRRAFYGCAGLLLDACKNDVTQHDDETAVAIMQDMVEQVQTFWNREVEKMNEDKE